MRRVSITEAKNRFNALLEYVRRGETVVIEERGVAIARLAPVNGSSADDDAAKLARLMRAGVIRAPERDPVSVMQAVLARAPVEARQSVVEALLVERRDSR